MLPSRKKFLGNGYSGAELYATTYGTAGNKTTLEETLACDYVKSIRALIVAVAAYTSSDVNVISFSLGVPLARKAILGGICVESGEELGPPLPSVRTFVGIGGPNFGNELCVLGLVDICNEVDGLRCGSKFLQDINARPHYEAQNVYSILSKVDEVVGYEACGKVTARIPASNATYAINVMHDPLLVASIDRQYQLVHDSS
ncbi:Lipase family protein [Aphelenchoides avenae]|nr:Lipase family protein [Aphelenchus avenae]